LNNLLPVSGCGIVSVALWLCLADGAGAQQTATTNAPADQDAQQIEATTNFVIVPPLITNQIPTDNGLTILPEATTTTPPLVGPRSTGMDQLSSPLMGTSVVGVPPGASAAFGGIVGAPLARWGPVDVHASMSYSVMYGNGIEAEPGEQEKTFINTFSPGLTLDLGNRWVLSYSPSYAVYSNPDFRNTLSESVVLNGHTTYEEWTFNLSQSYAYTSYPLIETGTQTTQEAYTTALTGSYQMSSRLSLQLGLNQNFRFAPAFNNLEEWTGSVWLNDQIMPQFGMGLGLTGGYDDLSTGSSMPFESMQGRINFNPGQKFSLALTGGAEATQFVHPSAPSLINPTFSVALNYYPWRRTSLNLTASRSVYPSFYANQITEVTGVGASFRQELSKKFSLTLSAGYTTEPLTSIEPAPLPQFFLGPPPTSTLTVVRNNDYTSFGITLSYAILKRGSISAFYSANQNSSGQANFKYSSSQVGLSASYRY
jgi:hypothetical protein